MITARSTEARAPRSLWARVCRVAWIAGLAMLVLSTSSRALADPARDRSDVYHAAVAYLRSMSDEEWLDEEARGVALPEAVLADRFVVGPRSTTLVSALDLDSIDARARRVRALAGLGLDVGADIQILVAELSQLRPNRIALSPTLRALATTKVGVAGYRVPIEIDNALAIRALYDVGITAAPPTPLAQRNAVEDALLFLLEFQRADGSWNLVHGDAAGGTPPAKRIFVTAEILRALLPYRTHIFSSEAAALSVGIDVNVGSAIDQAIVFLKGASYSNAIDRAASLLALIEAALAGSLPTSDSYLATASADLVSMGLSSAGNFGNSPLAASLAGQALLKGSDPALTQLAFDRDGDGVADGPDPDSDNDGSCDPGETDPVCSGTDAFPLDATEQVDSDHDGIGDFADPDRDGDGFCDPGESGAGCAGSDQFPTDAREHIDLDNDGVAGVADADDDGDGLSDVEEKIAGLDPEDVDTDGDSFRDATEVLAGTDATDSEAFPLPDGDIFPLGAPDGVRDVRDAVLALRIAAGRVVVSAGQETVFSRHADVAPSTGGTPDPDGVFGVADAAVIVRRVGGL